MEGTDLNWRKSSYSGNGGGECVEVGNADRILVRDTRDQAGPVLAFSAAAWERFADQVKRSLAAGSSRRSQGAFSCLMTEGALCRSAWMGDAFIGGRRAGLDGGLAGSAGDLVSWTGRSR
jgi:hypothetical protein